RRPPRLRSAVRRRELAGVPASNRCGRGVLRRRRRSARRGRRHPPAATSRYARTTLGLPRAKPRPASLPRSADGREESPAQEFGPGGMKLVATVLARDEADIIDAQVAFHLNAGVDFVIATDNNSRDGTTEILEAYQRDGCLHLIREPAEGLRQGEWVTRMARLAATDFGADWGINSDADEFWWPRGGPLQAA